MGVKCFWLTPTERVRIALRCFTLSKAALMADGCAGGYHNAMTWIGEFPIRWGDPGSDGRRYLGHWDPAEFRDDPRWPLKCEKCDYQFTPADEFQVFQDQIYTRSDGGETTLRDAPPGAMWDAWWYPEKSHWRGPDGRCLIVKCPDGHDWMIDGRANNCTMKDDNAHKCWVRHGEPPLITVDKNGHTCAAGGGSIMTPGYHGFLRNGEFT